MRKREAPNPYLDASRSHTSLIAGALNYRFLLGVAVQLCLLITLVAVGGAVHLAGQTKIEPFVFVLEKSTGLTWTLGKAERLFDLDDSLQKSVDEAALYAFFNDQRLVTPDAWEQDQAIRRVYKMVDESDPAHQQLQSWYRAKGQDPHERAQTMMVHSQAISLLPITKTTWQYDWYEVITNRSGGDEQQIRMRATAETYHREATNETTTEDNRANPSGLFVKQFFIVRLEIP